jgi:hypothetical protein
MLLAEVTLLGKASQSLQHARKFLPHSLEEHKLSNRNSGLWFAQKLPARGVFVYIATLSPLDNSSLEPSSRVTGMGSDLLQ